MTLERVTKNYYSIIQGKFKEPVDGKIPIDTFKDVENLIDLLDERFTKSEITGQEYDTDVKKKAEEDSR